MTQRVQLDNCRSASDSFQCMVFCHVDVWGTAFVEYKMLGGPKMLLCLSVAGCSSRRKALSAGPTTRSSSATAFSGLKSGPKDCVSCAVESMFLQRS